MITRIDFNEDDFLNSYEVNQLPIKSLEPAAKINLLVGANNSGKSRFMRYLLENFYNYKGPDLKKLISGSYYASSNKSNITLVRISKNDLTTLTDQITSQISVYIPKLDWRTFHQLVRSQDFFSEFDLLVICNEFEKVIAGLNYVDKVAAANNRQAIIYQRNLLLSTIYAYFPGQDVTEYLTTYVPSFRSLRKFLEPMEQQETNKYLPVKKMTYRKIISPILQWRSFVDYFTKLSVSQDWFSRNQETEVNTVDFNTIFSGETLFERINELRNSGEQKREILVGFENFLSSHFFYGEKIHLNAISHDGVEDIFVKIGTEKEFPIYQLGDGIQAIILLTFPLFYNRESPNYFIFYEEPELYLHPGMQRVFMEVLRSFENVQSVIVTHSNHIIETSLDYKDEVSIFSFEKIWKEGTPLFNVEILSSPNISLLNLLGVRNSSIFLSNCCLWVEGVSDRIYLKKFLELFFAADLAKGKLFFEDLHYSFLEFGGNQVAHYAFSEDHQNDLKIQARKITNRIMLIHDSDTNKQTRHDLLKKELAENYVQLPCLEIENLLSPEILKLTLQAYRKEKETELIFEDSAFDAHAMKPIAEVIASSIKVGTTKKIVTVAGGSTTSKIINKADFALTATSQMKHWDELSTQAQQLTHQIYAFILSHNS